MRREYIVIVMAMFLLTACAGICYGKKNVMIKNGKAILKTTIERELRNKDLYSVIDAADKRIAELNKKIASEESKKAQAQATLADLQEAGVEVNADYLPDEVEINVPASGKKKSKGYLINDDSLVGIGTPQERS